MLEVENNAAAYKHQASPTRSCARAQEFSAAGADMYTFHLEAAQPDTGKLSSTAVDAIVVEVRPAARGAAALCHILAPGFAAGGRGDDVRLPQLRALRNFNNAPPQTCRAVRDAGMHCGIALKPGTSEELVFPYVDAGGWAVGGCCAALLLCWWALCRGRLFSLPSKLVVGAGFHQPCASHIGQGHTF